MLDHFSISKKKMATRLHGCLPPNICRVPPQELRFINLHSTFRASNVAKVNNPATSHEANYGSQLHIPSLCSNIFLFPTPSAQQHHRQTQYPSKLALARQQMLQPYEL
jgi:hypothetical protein